MPFGENESNTDNPQIMDVDPALKVNVLPVDFCISSVKIGKGLSEECWR